MFVQGVAVQCFVETKANTFINFQPFPTRAVIQRECTKEKERIALQGSEVQCGSA